MKGGEILVRNLKGHESSWEHNTSMSKWITLEMRFQNNQTIDKSVQEQINKERENWRGILMSVFAIVKHLRRII